MRDMISVQRTPTVEPNVHCNAELWLETFRAMSGPCSSAAFHAATFSGQLSAITICGFNAVDLSVNGATVERTERDARLNNFDNFNATFQMAGSSTKVIQSGLVTEISVGEMAIVSSTRPVIYNSSDINGRWRSVRLPRSELMSHLGFEPRLDRIRRVPRLQRLLFDMVSNAVDIE